MTLLIQVGNAPQVGSLAGTIPASATEATAARLLVDGNVSGTCTLSGFASACTIPGPITVAAGQGLSLRVSAAHDPASAEHVVASWIAHPA